MPSPINFPRAQQHVDTPVSPDSRCVSRTVQLQSITRASLRRGTLCFCAVTIKGNDCVMTAFDARQSISNKFAKPARALNGRFRIGVPREGGWNDAFLACIGPAARPGPPPIGIHYVNITSSVAYPVIKRLAPAPGTPDHPPERGEPSVLLEQSVRRLGEGTLGNTVVSLIEIYGGPSL